MEIENLEKLENFLKNMSKNIENREKAILLLKKIVETIEKQFINLNLEVRENILNDFLVALKSYRIVTLKVVENVDYFRQIFSYPINKGKFVEKILMKKYGLLNDECISNYKGNYLFARKYLHIFYYHVLPRMNLALVVLLLLIHLFLILQN